ncbi:MAG: helix-turn-helix domain-containing protein [Candidatus Eremiobacteraeota bacterium]|nr:helix-turn-helix domain-containing protein [Candidatus Eremiobacteraeota bacterium]
MEDDRPAPGSPEFGTLLRHYRVAAGLSQEALAERAHMSANGIGALERGYRRTPQRETLELLAGALALDAQQRANLEQVAARSRPQRRLGGSMRFPPLLNVGTSALPFAVTNFIGRESELEEIARLVSEWRLVSLTGTGGMGKTQTALQIARTLRKTTEQAVHFIGLAPVADPSLVATTIASALGLHDVPKQGTLDTVLMELRNKRSVLILDNCEHVIDEVASIARALLSNCEGLRILATSREPLKIAGEHVYRLPSLDTSSAVALFADRAGAADRGFHLTAENEPMVAEICRRLDGIPLAIELAAARAGALSLQTLAEKLNDRFALLDGGSRTALPRQQTMRATIEWSYNLLSAPERRLFERLAVFAGGCTLSMVAAVCGDEGQSETEILHLLSSLVDKSLVNVDPDGEEPRYRLLGATQHYAREWLANGGESDAMLDRLARTLLRLAQDIAGIQPIYNARLDRSPKTLRTMRAERANFDEAMHWALAHRGNTQVGQELAWRVPFLQAKDAVHWLKVALASVTKSTPRPLIIKLEIQLAWCFVDLRDHEEAIAAARRAVTTSRKFGDARLLAAARRLLGRALTHAWNLDEAEFELQQSLASWRKLGDRRATATTLSYLAFASVRRGDYLRARKLNQEALDVLGDTDDRSARFIKIELARAEYGLGHYETALAYSREVLPALEAEAAEGGSTCVILMLNQCTFLLALDQFSEAMNVAQRALAATLDAQNPRPDLAPYVAGSLAKVALLARGDGSDGHRAIDVETCAKLIGWNEAVCASRGESDPDETSEELSILRRELGQKRVELLLAAGAALDYGAVAELMQSLQRHN